MTFTTKEILELTKLSPYVLKDITKPTRRYGPLLIPACPGRAGRSARYSLRDLTILNAYIKTLQAHKECLKYMRRIAKRRKERENEHSNNPS